MSGAPRRRKATKRKVISIRRQLRRKREIELKVNDIDYIIKEVKKGDTRAE